MSVRKGDRTEGELQVLNKARELKEYSLGILKKDKYFPKSTRWLFAYPIANEVRDACIKIRRANATYIGDGDEDAMRYRKQQQREAHAHLDAMYDLIDDAYKADYIEGHQAEFWTRLIQDTDNLLKAWMKSEKAKRN